MSDTGEQAERLGAYIVVPFEGLDFLAPDGRVLMRLSETPEDGTVLYLRGPIGRTTILLGVTDGAGVVSVQDTPSGFSSGMMVSAESATVAAMAPNKVKAGLQAMGTANMGLTKPGGGIAVQSLADAGGGGVHCFGPDQSLLSSIGACGTGGAINLYNPLGNLAISLSSQEQGGDVSAFNADGSDAASLGASAGSGGIVVWNAGGVPVFTVPVNKTPGFGRKEDKSSDGA